MSFITGCLSLFGIYCERQCHINHNPKSFSLGWSSKQAYIHWTFASKAPLLLDRFTFVCRLAVYFQAKEVEN